MARARPLGDQLVKLIVGAGQASPSPPVGPALGSKGVKSMDFCKVSLASTKANARIEKGELTSHQGIQRTNSALQPRHTHSSARRSPSRPILHIHPPHTTDRYSPPSRGRRLADQEQTPWRGQYCWAENAYISRFCGWNGQRRRLGKCHRGCYGGEGKSWWKR